MSIASEITRLSGVRNDIFTSISNKGVTVPQTATFSSCPGLIDSIVTGGGGGSNNLYNTTAEGSGSCFGTVTITASQIATPLTYDTGNLSLTASAWVSTGSMGTSRFVHNGYLMPWSAISPFTATGSFSLSRSAVGTVSTATYPFFGIPAEVSSTGGFTTAVWWGVSGGALAAGSTGLRYAQSISDTYANQFTDSITSMAQHLKPTDIVFLGFTGNAQALTGTAAHVQATVTGITSVSEWGYPYPDRQLEETASVTASAIFREFVSTATTVTGMALVGRSNTGRLVGELSSRTWSTTNTGYPLISVRLAQTAVSGAFPGVVDYAFSTATYPRTDYTFTSSMDLVSSTVNLI